jgi:hypothetical protein
MLAGYAVRVRCGKNLPTFMDETWVLWFFRQCHKWSKACWKWIYLSGLQGRFSVVSGAMQESTACTSHTKAAMIDEKRWLASGNITVWNMLRRPPVFRVPAGPLCMSEPYKVDMNFEPPRPPPTLKKKKKTNKTKAGSSNHHGTPLLHVHYSHACCTSWRVIHICSELLIQCTESGHA